MSKSLNPLQVGDIPTCHDESLLAKAERALFSTIFWWSMLSNSQLHGSCWPGLGGPNCTAQPQNHSKLFGSGAPELQTPEQVTTGSHSSRISKPVDPWAPSRWSGTGEHIFNLPTFSHPNWFLKVWEILWWKGILLPYLGIISIMVS